MLKDTFKYDLGRYIEKPGDYSFKTVAELFFYEESLWFIFAFRLAQHVRAKKIKSLYLPTRILHRLASLVTGIQIPIETKIGPGFYIGHGGPIVVNGYCQIGSFCNISTGVVIGVSGRGENRGVPIIGNCVYIAPGAKVVGKIKIGNDVVIGANAVVAADVDDKAVVVPPQSIIASHHGSGAYIQGRP